MHFLTMTNCYGLNDREAVSFENLLLCRYLLYFLQVLRKHGFRPTERELHMMIKNVDNHEGGIDFDEFIELLVNHGRNLEDDIAKSFRMFDIDGDGLITEDELRTTMSNLGEPMNDSEVKAMIAEADLDGDGKINFKEFQILMDNKTL